MPKPSTPKERVTCRVTVDGVLDREFPERRRVYTNKATGRRYVVNLGRRYALDAFNTYEYAYRLLPADGVTPPARLEDL